MKRRRRVDHISVRHYKHASEEELEYMSLEKQVTEYMPPCFLWQTATDELVPVQKSFLFAQGITGEKDSVCVPCIFKRETWIITC